MSKYFLEQMKEQKSGHIVSIASMSGLHPTPFSIPYSSTKFGINGFMSALTEHLRLEGWRSRIKTTCVFPYYIKTRADVIDFLSPKWVSFVLRILPSGATWLVNWIQLTYFLSFAASDFHHLKSTKRPMKLFKESWTKTTTLPYPEVKSRWWSSWTSGRWRCRKYSETEF